MKINLKTLIALTFAGLFLSAGGMTVKASDEVVNIYSARKEALILPILERFSEDTGIGFNLVTGKADELLKRIDLEGEATPADLFITVDAGRLYRAKESGVLQAIPSASIAPAPEHLRDADDMWVGLSMRARPIFYALDRVNPDDLSTYEQLADQSWQGRVCIRSSSNIYNQSLLASMIESNGPDMTLEWATAFVKNFARPPSGGDTDQIRAVAAGLCDVAIANTYYYGRLAASNKDTDNEVAASVGVFWPNQGDGDRGTHVNVSGGGVVKHSKNAGNAVRLIEYLLTTDSQIWYANINHEYPIVPSVPVSSVLEAIGDFRADDVNMTALGKNNRRAVELMDKAGWR